MCLRHVTSGWYVGLPASADRDAVDAPIDVGDIAAMIADNGVTIVDIREDVAAADLDLVLVAAGRRARSLARHSTPTHEVS